MSSTPYLDELHFTSFLAPKFSMVDLIKVDSLVSSIDNTLDRTGDPTNPIDRLINFWVDLQCGPVTNYGDLFGSYQLLYNLFEIVNLQGPTTKDMMRIHLLLQHLYQMLPAPTIQEVRESAYSTFKSCTGNLFVVFSPPQ